MANVLEQKDIEALGSAGLGGADWTGNLRDKGGAVVAVANFAA